MSKYVPFLKYKANELRALGEIDKNISENIIPFFDYPQLATDKIYEEGKFLQKIQTNRNTVKKWLVNYSAIYLDDFDISRDFKINGKDIYFSLVESIADIKNVIPVVSLSYTNGRLNVINDLLNKNLISPEVIAFRIIPEEYNYALIKGDIEYSLKQIFSHFQKIDIIFDCRVCTLLDVNKITAEINKFIDDFSIDYPVRRKIITGSSIPASVRDVVVSNKACHLERKEIEIIKDFHRKFKTDNLFYGDYTIVSPYYPDMAISPEIYQNVIAAKLIYSYEDKHYFIRGSSLKTKGATQYFTLAKELCGQAFFRGANYSIGDQYLAEKSQSIGSNCSPSSVLKPAINAHITYMVNQGKP